MNAFYKGVHFFYFFEINNENGQLFEVWVALEVVEETASTVSLGIPYSLKYFVLT